MIRKKKRLLSSYSRAHHPSPLHPSFFPRDAERIDLDSDCGAYLGRCSLTGEGKNPIRSRETRNLNFERSRGAAAGGKLGDEMPREVSFFPSYEIDARHITSCPRCRRHPRSRRSEGVGGKGRRALISLSKFKNFTLSYVDAATPLWCFKLLKRAIWVHNDVRASRGTKEWRGRENVAQGAALKY